jgi:hypothetical protein
MVNKSVVAKSTEDLYPKSLEAMADKSVSPWAVVIRLLRSGRLLSVANQSSLPYSESYTYEHFASLLLLLAVSIVD